MVMFTLYAMFYRKVAWSTSRIKEIDGVKRHYINQVHLI
jgi:hypothetical protein